MMSSVLWWLRIGGGLLFLLDRSIAAKTPSALSVVPSLNWYGDDGDWSAISLRVGTPQQWLDVMVSTVSSENWIVGTGACAPKDSLCMTSRGGHLFEHNTSSTWKDEGFFQFSVDANLGNQGYGWYGLDSITLGSTGVTVTQSVIGVFNGSGPLSGTQYMLGFFGLGTTVAQFGNEAPLPCMNALVERNGAIPSHSYGYTAGAKYQQKGQPLSLTLGGYDTNRFIPHNTSFNLNPEGNPQAAISSIYVQSTSSTGNFTTPRQLLQSSDRVLAVIDSSTPFLWLPEAVCDRFARALGLTYNDTLKLYTYDNNPSQHDTLVNSGLSFTFALSDLTASPAIVNVTLPFAAFDLRLTYPAIPNSTYGDPSATKNYFPLRRAKDDTQYTIGRAFLQEAYLITDYERNIFSVHQSVHVANPLGNTSIVSILQPDGSQYSSPDSSKSTSHLSKGAITGIAVSISIIAIICIILSIILYRRRRSRLSQKSASHDLDDEKPSTTSTITTTPPSRSLLSRLLHPCASPPQTHHLSIYETHGNDTFPTEVPADGSHARYELPAPLGPVELESESGTTLAGTSSDPSHNGEDGDLSAYERTRRKLERAQVEAARVQMGLTPIEDGAEKSERDISTMPTYRPPSPPHSPLSREVEEDLVSPIIPDTTHGWGTLGLGIGSGNGRGVGSGSGESSQPSPVSPGFHHDNSPVSPIGPPPGYRRFGAGTNRMNTSDGVAAAGRGSNRQMIDGSNVVYAGRLPGHVRVPVVVEGIEDEGTNSSLGSAYTDVEEMEAANLYGAGSGSVPRPNSANVRDVENGRAGGIGDMSGSGSGDGSGSGNPISPLTSHGSGSGSGPTSNPSLTSALSISPLNTSHPPIPERQPQPQLPHSDEVELTPASVVVSPNEHTRRRFQNDNFIHIPQPAENRFSWEEERISGVEDQSGSL